MYRTSHDPVSNDLAKKAVWLMAGDEGASEWQFFSSRLNNNRETLTDTFRSVSRLSG